MNVKRRQHYPHGRYVRKTGNYEIGPRVHSLCNAWPLARYVTENDKDVDCRKCLRLLMHSCE